MAFLPEDTGLFSLVLTTQYFPKYYVTYFHNGNAVCFTGNVEPVVISITSYSPFFALGFLLK